MGTNCAPLVADLFLFCYERDFMLSLSEDNQSGVIEAFNSTSLIAWSTVKFIPSELKLNKASFLDLHLSISDGFVKIKFMINEMILILIL